MAKSNQLGLVFQSKKGDWRPRRLLWKGKTLQGQTDKQIWQTDRHSHDPMWHVQCNVQSTQKKYFVFIIHLNSISKTLVASGFYPENFRSVYTSAFTQNNRKLSTKPDWPVVRAEMGCCQLFSSPAAETIHKCSLYSIYQISSDSRRKQEKTMNSRSSSYCRSVKGPSAMYTVLIHLLIVSGKVAFHTLSIDYYAL